MHPSPFARDIMVKDLVTLQPRMHVGDGLARLLRCTISGAPVVEGSDFLGVFSEKSCMSVLALAARQAADSYPIRAKDFMVTRLITFTPHMDVVEVIGQLLKHRISGAPVLDDAGNFLGVVSERYSMRVLIDAAYDQLPTSEAGPFMNTDMGRVIAEEASLREIVELFLNTNYRRLVVLKDGRLRGQISRRDAIRAGQHLVGLLEQHQQASNANQAGSPADEPGEALAEQPSLQVAAFMDAQARTIGEDLDLLGIAQIFLNTNYRRLPVVRDGKLIGQVSRRDVLQATYDLLAVAPERETNLLYLSSLLDRTNTPFSQ